MTLRLSPDLASRIRALAAETYPHECCGALLGSEAAGGRLVQGLFPLNNRRQDSPQNRFSISPDDFRRAEKAAQDQRTELIGWYHSHPDHPARPSEFDREHAWPWYCYVIVTVERGEPGTMTSWRLADDRSRFDEESIELAAARPGS